MSISKFIICCFISIFYLSKVNGQVIISVEKNYPNGLLKEKYQGVVIGRDTTKKGKYSFYYESGRLMQEGFFKDNKPDSIWLNYYPNSARKSLFNYNKGHKEGGFVFWSDDGAKRE